MDTWQRRTAYYLVVLVAVVVGYTAAYQYGMAALEGRPVTALHALQVVVETFTTTGFGADAPWTTPAMNVLVILMDTTGTVLIFLALPVFLFPLLRDALSTTVPTAVDDGRSDHVVIATYTPRVEPLVAELDSRDVGHVIVEPDADRARERYEAGDEVIRGAPDTAAGLEGANLADARAIVADASDRIDVSIILTAREMAEGVRVVSVVEEPDRARYHELAGADVVLSPRSLLGESLARKVTTGVTADLGDAIEIGDDFDIAEVPVDRESELVGRRLDDIGLRERAGVNVIGAWFRGEFRSPPPPDATVEAGTVLLVTGRPDQLERFGELFRSEARPFDRGTTIVVGHGEVGRAVTAALDAADRPYTVVDRDDDAGADVVGDATDPGTYERAGIEDARAVILALPDDTTTEFATLVIRDLAPDVNIIARAEGSEAVRKIYRAGADYVLALATVTGRMTASAVLEEEVIATDTQVEVVKTPAPGLVGRTLGEARVRSRTGCTVVAAERDGEVLTDVGADFRVREGDELIIAGTDEGTNRFTELLG